MVIGMVGIAEGVLSKSTTDLAAIIVRNKTESNINDVSYNFVNQRPDPAEPGGYVEVRLKLENVGTDDARNVLFEFLPKFPFTLAEGTEQVRLGRVGARQVGEDAYVIFYRLKVDEDAIEGNNRVNFRFSPNGGLSWTQLEPMFIRVQTNDAILVIEDVSTDSTVLAPGTTTDLEITVVNTADSVVKDLRFKLDLADASFAPVGSSNEKMIDQLAAKASKTLTFRLNVAADAASKVHKVPLEIAYFDEIGRNYTKNNDIGIVVNDAPDFLVNIDDTEIYTRGGKGNIIVSVSNVGSSEIQYLTATLQPSKDYTILSSPSVYLGNLDSDDFDSAEYEIFVSAKKAAKLDLELTYKDAFNKELAKTVQLELPLYSGRQAKKLGLVQGGSLFGSIFSLAIFVILTVGWLFMVFDVIKISGPRYKRILWIVLVIGGYVIGAGIYWLMKKRKKKQ